MTMQQAGRCAGCGRYDRPVEVSYQHGGRQLCPVCFDHPPMIFKASAVYDSNTLAPAPRKAEKARPKTPVVEPNDTRTRTRTRETAFGETKEEPKEALKVALERALTDELLEEHKAGRIEPESVELHEIPAGSPAALLELREDFALVLGLRLAVGEDRPVPYGCEWVATRMGRSKRHVARLLHQLVQMNVIRCVGNMENRGKGPEGTRLYEPVGILPPNRPCSESDADTMTLFGADVE